LWRIDHVVLMPMIGVKRRPVAAARLSWRRANASNLALDGNA